MKATHVLIGAGIAVAAIIVAKKFLGSSEPAKPADTSGGLGGLINDARGLVDSVKGLFRAGPAPSAPPREAPVPGLNFDADGDQNGQYASNVIQFRTLA